MALSVNPNISSAPLTQAVLGSFDMLPLILKELPPEEIAKAGKVCRFFHAITQAVKPLREAVNFAKYTKIGADLRFFSEPLGCRYGNGWKILTHKDIFRLAERLQNRGNHQTDLSKVLGRYFPYTELEDLTHVKHRPTHIISKIPNEEIGRVYYHLWKIIGSPPGANAGKDAFYDRKGLHSTPAQKAAALMAFLFEKAQVVPSASELDRES